MTLDKDSACTAWNYNGQRLAAGSVNGTLAIYDAKDPASSSFTCTSRFKVRYKKFLAILFFLFLCCPFHFMRCLTVTIMF